MIKASDSTDWRTRRRHRGPSATGPIAYRQGSFRYCDDSVNAPPRRAHRAADPPLVDEPILGRRMAPPTHGGNSLVVGEYNAPPPGLSDAYDLVNRACMKPNESYARVSGCRCFSNTD